MPEQRPTIQALILLKVNKITLLSDIASFVKLNCSRVNFSTIVIDVSFSEIGYLIRAVKLAAKKLKKSESSCKNII